MQFLEVSSGVAVGMFFGFALIGLIVRAGKKPADDRALEVLQRRNELTEQTNNLLGDIADELRKTRM